MERSCDLLTSDLRSPLGIPLYTKIDVRSFTCRISQPIRNSTSKPAAKTLISDMKCSSAGKSSSFIFPALLPSVHHQSNHCQLAGHLDQDPNFQGNHMMLRPVSAWFWIHESRLTSETPTNCSPVVQIPSRATTATTTRPLLFSTWRPVMPSCRLWRCEKGVFFSYRWCSTNDWGIISAKTTKTMNDCVRKYLIFCQKVKDTTQRSRLRFPQSKPSLCGTNGGLKI